MTDPLAEQLRALVGELHPEDGVNPALLRKPQSSTGRVKLRKHLGLCRQVFRTLHLSIPADLDVQVLSVTPDRDPARLIVLLAPTAPEIDPTLLLRRIAALGPSLRCEVGNAIHRRKTPELVFRLSRRSDELP